VCTHTYTLIYEGKSKRVYVKNRDELILEFKDEVTARDGALRSFIRGKGIINARVSAYFFSVLNKKGIDTHFLDYDGARKMAVKKLRMLPLEVIVRNYAYGSQLKRIPLLKPLQELNPPIVEFHYKDDSLHDPLIIVDDIINSGIATHEELNFIIKTSLRINDILREVFSEAKLKLIDFKIEFGRDRDNKLILADEISGDTFRVLDDNGKHLDKEVFRRTGDPKLLIDAYIRLCEKLGIKVDDIDFHG